MGSAPLLQSNNRMTTKQLALCFFALVATWCAPGQVGDGTDEGSADGALRRYTVADDEHPEAGRLHIHDADADTWAGCTATLVGSRTILTAAHCFDFTSGAYADRRGYFTIQPADGSAPVGFDLHRVATLGTELQVGGDLAVAQLDVSVPAGLASPAPIAEEWPDGDDDMTVYGYGTFGSDCSHDSDGHKRKWTTSVGGTLKALTCPGDSGGPYFHDKSGAIIAVVKGDFLGLEWVWSAVRHRDWIEDRIGESERGELSVD